MTETTNDEEIILEQELTEEGRYIPYSGGSMGWFENSGVPNVERGNNYLFHTVMQSESVRSKQFQRWGASFNRREGHKRYRRETSVTLVMASSEVRGSTRDISSHGVRLQFLEEIAMVKGDTCTLRVHAEETDAPLVDMASKVVWVEKIGRIRPVWNLGLTFTSPTEEQSDILRPLLTEK